MGPKKLFLCLPIALCLGIPGAAHAQESSPEPPYVAGEVLVRFAGGHERVLDLPPGVEVTEAARALGGNPRVGYAVPNYIATAAACPTTVVGFPQDPGFGGIPCGWQDAQWNFTPCAQACGDPAPPQGVVTSPGGIDAFGAWQTLAARGRPGASGVKLAHLDTGVAFRNHKKFRKSPDFSRSQFARGFDFVDRDKLPVDEEGHGTHTAGTIAERTNNGVANTGLAHGARLIPVRVLDASGSGTARDIAKGIRYAARRKARVINLSFEFSEAVQSCRQIKGVCQALRFATRRGAVAVAAAGNTGQGEVAFPGRAGETIAVGGTTEDGCLAGYSSRGAGLDLVAPGGGAGFVGCTPTFSNRPIFQLTYQPPGFRRFGFPSFYEGTSMASAHVAGVAAMVIASGVLGPAPTPALVECQLKASSRDLGAPGVDSEFGFGLINAADAVAARSPNC
jgi:serine protease